ncbi:MAG: YhcH/YjgK/YiaL family protein [Ginsengibacter sp.]
MKRIISLIIVLLIFSVSFDAAAQTTSKSPASKDAKKWFNKKEWLGGLQFQPHPTINKTEFARQYQANKSYWDKAFAYLKEQNLETLAVGKYPIDGENVFAIVTNNPTKDHDSAMWESHHNYIDLHCVISGEEKISVCPMGKLTVSKPYDASKDVVNYSGAGKTYLAEPKVFFLFFPSDAHRPNITTGGNKKDKKIVIKIRYAD